MIRWIPEIGLAVVTQKLMAFNKRTSKMEETLICIQSRMMQQVPQPVHRITLHKQTWNKQHKNTKPNNRLMEEYLRILYISVITREVLMETIKTMKISTL
jgi:hypothetical protein